MKILFKILIIPVILVVLVALALGYFGFIPGLSAVLGTNKPRDLGMVYSAQKYEEAVKKAKIEKKTLEPSNPVSVSYEGSHPVKEKFSDEELTSAAYNRDWVDYPISDVQIRINDDNTCEVAGMLDLKKMGRYVSMMGVSQEDYQTALEKAKIPFDVVPFYAKGFGEAKNDAGEGTLTNLEVGRFPVPKKLLDEYHDPLEQFGNVIINSIPGLSVNEARFEDGSIYFDGTLPDVEYTKR